MQVGTTTHEGAATTGIAAEDDHRITEIMIVIFIVVAAVMEAIAAIIILRIVKRNSRAIAVGWNRAVKEEEEDADSVAEETSTTLNWDRAMSASSKSSLAPVILALISTNTKIYPWRRRARMFRLTSTVSMICS